MIGVYGSGAGTNFFEITADFDPPSPPPLTLTDITPNPVAPGLFTLTLTGTGFQPGAVVDVFVGGTTTLIGTATGGTVLTGGTQLQAAFLITTLGVYDLQVRNPDGSRSNKRPLTVGEGNKPGTFTLSASPECWPGDSQFPAGPGVRLTWTPASNAISYDIYRNGSLIRADFTGTSFFNITGLTAGQSYNYQVIAKNVTGQTPSNTVGAIAPTNCGGGVPSGVTLTAIDPNSVAPGLFTLTLTGTGFQPGAVVDVFVGGTPGFVGTATGGTVLNGGTQLQAVFLITTLGTYDLQVRNPDGSRSTKLALTVGGTPPSGQITIGPLSLNFGSVPVGSCAPASFAVQHVLGSGPVSGTVSASPNPPFSITSNSSFTVSNGSAVNVGVQFCPGSATGFSGSATVSSNASSTNTNTVSLSGTGTSPPPSAGQITIGPLSLNFGSVQVGSCAPASIGVQHVGGTGPVSGTVSAGPNPPFSITSNSSFTVSNGSAVNVGVQFCPGSATGFSGSATVSSNASSTNTNTVSLSGTGTSSPGPVPGNFSLNAFAECSGNNPAIRLSWSISSNATSFEVYRNNALLVGGLPNSAGFYVDTSVSAGTTYTYFIRARNAAGFTDSNTVQFTAPTNCVFTLSAQAECSGTVSQIRLRWSVPPTGAGSYEVFRNDVSIFSTVNSNLTEYVNTGVSPGVSYNYFVRASTSAGPRDSTSAAATALNCGTTPPGQFTLTATLECSNGVPQVRLNWTLSAGEDFYQVLRNGVVLTGVSQSVQTFLDTSVVNGTAYNYVIRAINSGGQTDSNQANVTASCATPQPPGIFTLSAIATCSEITPFNHLNWTGAAGVTLPYEIYRNSTLIFTQELGSYDDLAVTAGATYTYFVRAKNSAGFRDSNSVQITTRSDCAAPVTTAISSISPQTVTVGDGTFTLTVMGSNFAANAKILWSFSGITPSNIITPTVVNSSLLTVQVTQGSGGYSFFFAPAVYVLQVINPGAIFFEGQRSNIVQFTVLNPIPVISSISGTCKASLNCTPSNGFDVRINGTGFVNNSPVVNGVNLSSTTITINGNAANFNTLGQGPVFTQLQLFANGSLIPTSGTYDVHACNEGTQFGKACSMGSLTVIP